MSKKHRKENINTYLQNKRAEVLDPQECTQNHSARDLGLLPLKEM